MSQTVNITSKSGFYEKSNEHIFSNIYVILGIVLVSLGFVGYAVYQYTQNTLIFKILENSSYYGTNIAIYEPLFQDKAKTVIDCINVCESNIICDGITYNSDTQECSGTKNGQVRNENANMSAWVKPPSDKILTANLSRDFIKSILVGYTRTMTVVNANKIQNPYQLGVFSYSFNITIYDFYKNYGSWRHVFHRGTQIVSGTSLNYQSWENLIVDFPIQSIGVWLAPFTNNLRIAVTTESLANNTYGSSQDAFVQKCNSLTKQCYITDMPNGKWADNSKHGDDSIPKTRIDTFVEYFDHDLQNIPINTQINIAIVFRGNIVETWINGKLKKINNLDGVPVLNKSSLYVMNDLTFGGEISNLLYYPDALLVADVQSIMEFQPKKPPGSN
jgi:hypothetical protein